MLEIVWSCRARTEVDGFIAAERHRRGLASVVLHPVEDSVAEVVHREIELLGIEALKIRRRERYPAADVKRLDRLHQAVADLKGTVERNVVVFDVEI